MNVLYFYFQTIIAWVKHDPCTRLKDLEKLSSAIHLIQVPMETLVLTKQDSLIQNSSLQLQIKHTINTILEERYDSDVRAVWATVYKEKARRMLRFCDDQDVRKSPQTNLYTFLQCLATFFPIFLNFRLFSLLVENQMVWH